MAFKVASTTVVNNSAQISWNIITGMGANTFANSSATSGANSNQYLRNITLLNGVLTIIVT